MSDEDALIGRTLGHFRIDAKLGEGGMGVVYRATDERLRREVALKVLPDALAGDPERRRRFLREARAAAAVSHANIAAVYDIGAADGHVFIAMELLSGETLRTRLEPGLAYAEALRIAREIAKGLAQAHESGVVHRDLKPENVMVARDGSVKILDFGLAKLVEVEAVVSGTDATASLVTADGRVMGTPPYMSPEQAEGRGDIDARTDVFSFGTMLYEMLAGVRPFRGDSSIAVLYAVLHREPEPLRDVSPDVPAAAAEIVTRCLRKAKEERFASGGEVAAALAGEAAAEVSGAAARTLPTPKASAVSHMGTALGATVAADAPRAVASVGTAKSDARPARRRAAWPWVVMGGVVAIVTVGAALGPPHPGATAPSAGAPSGGAPPASAPLQCNAEASRLYAEAVETWATRSTNDSVAVFERAVEADRGCAPALLRLALFSPAERSASLVRNELAEARAHRERLTEAERSLLDVVAPASAQPPAGSMRSDALRVLAQRFPDDVLVQFLFGLEGVHEHPSEAKAALERVLALQPRSGPAYGLLADLATSSQERQELLERCAEETPRHVYCDTMRGATLVAGFDCQALERFAHEVVARNPGRQASGWLVDGLAATGASSEALDEALRQMHAGIPGVETDEKSVGVAALEGDAARLEGLLRADPHASDSDFEARAAWVTKLALLLDETGRASEADALVRQTVRAAPALVPPRDPAVLAEFYARAIAARALTRAEVDAALGPVPATREADAQWWSWVARHLLLARSAEDAREALATMPARPKKPWEQDLGDVDYEIARVRALSGDFAAARRDVDSALRRCNVLSWVDYRPRAFFLLGEASEHTGDLDAARAAYQTVVTKWGGLKPKAVLADRARARLAALARPGSP